MDAAERPAIPVSAGALIFDRAGRLRNCPFHPLAARSPEFVCGLNHAFLAGVVDGLQASAMEAVLDPRAGECCVELRARAAGTESDRS